MPATMTRNYSHAEIPPVNFTPATERRPATRPALAELTADEIEAMVQAAVKKYLTPRELANEGANKLYARGRTRYFTLNEMCAVAEAMTDDALDEKEQLRFRSICPIIDPDWAMYMKKHCGKEWLLAYGRDLTPAEIRFGKGWLDK
ncbi:hypothetical protein FACS1894139_07860 [Planctomycetales bacterium]|nr:hypothetical protein FACS1894107_09360 [Planctomycetales bacterium]GHS99226.1 hypothetical protein FACS1894108_08800 [Planctomycetales bacterium]GHT04916.1 hypothetical protein FACS1894139_07860 [Planctomycetales bacterium]